MVIQPLLHLILETQEWIWEHRKHFKLEWNRWETICVCYISEQNSYFIMNNLGLVQIRAHMWLHNTWQISWISFWRSTISWEMRSSAVVPMILPFVWFKLWHHSWSIQEHHYNERGTQKPNSWYTNEPYFFTDMAAVPILWIWP